MISVVSALFSTGFCFRARKECLFKPVTLLPSAKHALHALAPIATSFGNNG